MGVTSFDDDCDEWELKPDGEDGEPYLYILYSLAFVGKWFGVAIVALSLLPIFLLWMCLMPLIGVYFGFAVGIWLGYAPAKTWFNFIEKKLVQAKMLSPIMLPYSWGFYVLPILAIVALCAAIILFFNDDFGLGREEGAEIVSVVIELLAFMLLGREPSF